MEDISTICVFFGLSRSRWYKKKEKPCSATWMKIEKQTQMPKRMENLFYIQSNQLMPINEFHSARRMAFVYSFFFVFISNNFIIE